MDNSKRQRKSPFFMKNDPDNVSKSKYSSYVVLFIVFVCILIPFVVEIIPRYITIAIPPPTDSYGAHWRTTTKSVLTFQSISTIRVFIWRQDAILAYENTDEIPSWNSISIYFDEYFSKHGWEKNESSILCSAYLPESAFLQPGENGFISYSRIDDSGNDNETSADDVICLAIWNDEGYANVYKVVMLTARNSFFSHLLTVFEL